MTSCLANPGNLLSKQGNRFQGCTGELRRPARWAGLCEGVSAVSREASSGRRWSRPAEGQLAAPVSIAALCCPSEHTGSVAGTLLRLPRAPGGPRQARVKACGDSSCWRGDSGAPTCLPLPPPARGDATAAFRCCRREAQTGGVENSLHFRLLCFSLKKCLN